VLWRTEFGAAHALGHFWNAETGRFLGHYVNLQAPLQRSEFGFDTMDHQLDVVVEPNGALALEGRGRARAGRRGWLLQRERRSGGTQRRRARDCRSARPAAHWVGRLAARPIVAAASLTGGWQRV